MPVTGSTLSKRLIFFKTLWTELCPPTNSYVEALGPSEMVFEDGVFGKTLDLYEVMRVESSW